MFQIKDLHAGLTLVFLIVFNAVFFIVGGTVRTTGEWISYAFIHFSYLMLLLTPKLINNSSITSTLGVSVYFISFLYFVITLLVGCVFVLVRPENYIPELVTYIIISGVYFVVLLTSLIANEKTVEAEEEHRQDMLFVSNATNLIKQINAECTGTTIEKNVERLYDLIRTSQVKSDPSVWDEENVILQELNQLATTISETNHEESEKILERIEKSVRARNGRLSAIRRS